MKRSPQTFGNSVCDQPSFTHSPPLITAAERHIHLRHRGVLKAEVVQDTRGVRLRNCLLLKFRTPSSSAFVPLNGKPRPLQQGPLSRGPQDMMSALEGEGSWKSGYSKDVARILYYKPVPMRTRSGRGMLKPKNYGNPYFAAAEGGSEDESILGRGGPQAKFAIANQ